MSDSYEPNIQLHLEFLRVVEPESAKLFEKILRDHEEDEHLADIAYLALGEALKRMVVDLHQDRSARDYLVAAAEALPATVFSSSVCMDAALGYLAEATDREAFTMSGLDAGHFLDQRVLTELLEGEKGHLVGIARLRAARQAAWSDRGSST